MRNFISDDDIEQAILAKLKVEPFKYDDIIVCDADPSKRDDLNDGTGRTSKRECVLPDIMLSALKRINPTIPEDKIKEIVKIEVGIDFNKSEQAYDIVLYSEFNCKEDLDSYQINPKHVEVASYVKKVTNSRIVADYIV